MSTSVGSRPKRRYDSSGRRAAAAQRRERVVECAAARFASGGWSSTTLAAIAADAEVSIDLVTQSFGTKANLLLAAIRQVTFGPDQADLDDAVRSLGLEGLDRDAAIDRVADFAVPTLAAMAPLIPALVQAADAEPSAARVHEDITRRRRETTAWMLGAVLEREAPTTLVDEVMLLTSASTYLELVERQGWPREQFARWLSAAMTEAVERHAP